MNDKLLIILGPTAVGKSGLAIRLAGRFGGEIISADSMQAYKGLNIGTAKIPLKERGGIKHHLLDVMGPDQRFSAGMFVNMAENTIKSIFMRENLPIIIGGTGLYIRALLKGLFPSPVRNKDLTQKLESIADTHGTILLHRILRSVDYESAQRIAFNDKQRLIRALEIYFLTKKPLSQYIMESPFSADRYDNIKIGLMLTRAELYKRIEERVDKMFQAGWVGEVKELMAKGYSAECHAFKALGYREIVRYLNGELPINEAVSLIKKETRRYAKRQLTWFRKEEGIHWYDMSKGEDVIYKQVESFIHQKISKMCPQ